MSDFTEDAHGSLWVITTEGALRIPGGDLARGTVSLPEPEARRE